MKAQLVCMFRQLVAVGALTLSAGPALSATASTLDRKLTFSDGSELALTCATAYHAAFGLRRPASVAGDSWRCKETIEKSDPAILWVHGGPFGEHDRTRPLHIQQMLLDRGYVIYEPKLHGDEGVEREMAEDGFVDDASLVLDQLRTTLKYIRKKHDRIVVLGESLGGFWVSFFAEGLRDSDALVLVNPLLLTPREGALNRVDRTAFLAPGDQPLSDEQASAVLEYWPKLVASYFGPLLEKTIADGLANGSPTPVLISIGDADERVGIDALPAIRDRLGGKVEWMIHAGMGHAYFDSLSQYERFAHRLDELAGKAMPEADAAARSASAPPQHP